MQVFGDIYSNYLITLVFNKYQGDNNDSYNTHMKENKIPHSGLCLDLNPPRGKSNEKSLLHIWSGDQGRTWRRASQTHRRAPTETETWPQGWSSIKWGRGIEGKRQGFKALKLRAEAIVIRNYWKAFSEVLNREAGLLIGHQQKKHEVECSQDYDKNLTPGTERWQATKALGGGTERPHSQCILEYTSGIQKEWWP